MSQKGVLVALLAGCCAMAAQAGTQTYQLNWPATASKSSGMEISLTHPGQQPVNSASTANPIQTEAINLSNPDFNTTYQLQARTLYASLPAQAGADFKLALNGQSLPRHHAQPLTQATRYFLSYQAPAAKPDQTGEAAYELLVYWHG
ncbi:hypothetical protein ACFX5Z_00320 [Aeromonas dhakensis]|uniref:hypothetical protein n=1 Tax=Aeromonas TaxID=642 RepID=UPI00035D5704|nr:hypothetical protein [Aeromonas dhakensis]AHV37307.1 hypothetical protein AI20_19680 [Aeromonas hydrophila YL17]KMK98687.1 hypothetical protein VL01_00060 [Aeromonas enteropelogenes]QKF97733.1 hypothetical protein HQK30_00390 [Aeromonas hydrophila]MBL0527030.1 hypothetical protein [Aeromonas dhakensis]MBQ4670935.1 hypothetical protein [Aeromonas dhakensis]